MGDTTSNYRSIKVLIQIYEFNVKAELLPTTFLGMTLGDISKVAVSRQPNIQEDPRFIVLLSIASTVAYSCYKNSHLDAGDRIMELIKPDLDEAQYESYQEEWIVLFLSLFEKRNPLVYMYDNLAINAINWVLVKAYKITISICSIDTQSLKKPWQDAWIHAKSSAVACLSSGGWTGTEEALEFQSTIKTWCDTWHGEPREEEAAAMERLERAINNGLTDAALMAFEEGSAVLPAGMRKARKTATETNSSIRTGSRYGFTYTESLSSVPSMNYYPLLPPLGR